MRKSNSQGTNGEQDQDEKKKQCGGVRFCGGERVFDIVFSFGWEGGGLVNHPFKILSNPPRQDPIGTLAGGHLGRG